MIVELHRKIFTLTYEECRDKPERYFQGGNMWDFICLLCGFAELCFDFPSDNICDPNGVKVYNYKTGMTYLVKPEDAKNFYQGIPIHLFGM